MAAYLFEPAVATPSNDYSTVYSNIATYLNQAREELADIDTDTTSLATTLLLIATSLATIATNSTTVANNTTTIATNTTNISDQQTIIAEKQTAMETYQKKLKELGEGAGIHIIGAYEAFSLATTYRLLIEQAKILEGAPVTRTLSGGGKKSTNTFEINSDADITAGQLVIGTGIPDRTYVISTYSGGRTVTLVNSQGTPQNFTVDGAGSYKFYTPGGGATPSQVQSAIAEAERLASEVRLNLPKEF